jgi:hypothetical protein
MADLSTVAKALDLPQIYKTGATKTYFVHLASAPACRRGSPKTRGDIERSRLTTKLGNIKPK